MHKNVKVMFAFFAVLMCLCVNISAEEIKGKLIEGFEDSSGFTPVNSDGVDLTLFSENGRNGKSLGLGINFNGKAGYVVAAKEIKLTLPENYKFTFYIKGNLPPNTVEFKLIDKDENVYWKKFDKQEFSDSWQELTVKKAQVRFAWGPSGGGSIRDVAKMEIAVSCGEGGVGNVYLDDFMIYDLGGFKTKYDITATASSSEKDEFDVSKAVDGDMSSRWASVFEDNQWVKLDLGSQKEFVGFDIHWEAAYAKEYMISVSKNGGNWDYVYSTKNGDGGIDAVYFGKRKARYIKMETLKRGTQWGNSIYEIEIKGPEDEIVLSASDNSKEANLAMDGNSKTAWKSLKNLPAELMLELKNVKDIGGLHIYWTENSAASYKVMFSDDNKKWEEVFSTNRGNGKRDRVYFKEKDAKYIKILCNKSSTGKGFGISEIEVKGYEESGDENKYYEVRAEEYPKGYFPKYFTKEASYWNVVGVSEDIKEALINEEGAFETERERHIVEPFLYMGGELITWADVKTGQFLKNDYLPMPIVKWDAGSLELKCEYFAYGEPGSSSLYAMYTVKNKSNVNKKGKLFLAVRPFQVSPPWQFLNMKGGVARINKISYDGRIVDVNGSQKIVPFSKPDSFGACTLAEGDIVDFLENGKLPKNQSTDDSSGFSSGALEYSFDLKPNESITCYIASPFHSSLPDLQPNSPKETIEKSIEQKIKERIDFWESRLSNVNFIVPKSKKKFVDVLKSNMAYILINRDEVRIQPGSRSYLRSWIRDGSMTSSAILRLGNYKEVREYLDWYSGYIFPYDRVPCVVDNRGPEGLPENDSNGEFIYAFLQYYYFSKDKVFLKKHFNKIRRAADFIIKMRNERKTDFYKNGNEFDRAKYGLVPESISHEGYSDAPMHSYWDNFFSLKGLKDAAKIAEIMNRPDLAGKYSDEVLDYRKDLYNSINLAMQNTNIDFIPGCAEKGDFDATSTAIGVFPCGEMKFIPEGALNRTFDKYYDYFIKRIDPDFDWYDMTPYEVRNCQTFVIMNKRERVEKMFDFLFFLQRPYNWNHWGEIVFKDPKPGKWIGDMPHTWIGSGYINAVRSMLVYEQEWDDSLVLFAGIPKSWFDTGEDIGIENAHTYYGVINLKAKKINNNISVNISGDINVPGSIIIKPPYKGIKSVTVNGKKWDKFGEDEVRVDESPCEIKINY